LKLIWTHKLWTCLFISVYFIKYIDMGGKNSMVPCVLIVSTVLITKLNGKEHQTIFVHDEDTFSL